MGYLSRNNLEKIATRIFNDYKHLPRFAGQQVDHVDPEILACGLCGLRIDHFHLSKDRADPWNDRILRRSALKSMTIVDNPFSTTLMGELS